MPRGDEVTSTRIGIDELGERDGPRLHRQPELARGVEQAARHTPGSRPSTDGVISTPPATSATLAFVASPTRPSCATSSASS